MVLPLPSRRLRRMAAALLALAGLFVSLYLLLYHLGYYGSLACGPSGGCSIVQASRYATLAGLPVPAWGVGWYASIFVLAMVDLSERVASSRAVDLALFLLALVGVLFSLYLTGIELFVLHAVCRWCVVSAVLTVCLFGLCLPGPGQNAPA